MKKYNKPEIEFVEFLVTSIVTAPSDGLLGTTPAPSTPGVLSSVSLLSPSSTDDPGAFGTSSFDDTKWTEVQ